MLDELKVGRYHIGLFALCFITMFVDGMDFVVIAVTAPAILREWQLSPTLVGTIFGVGNFGLLLGAFLFGRIGDRYGRRPGIVAGVLLFSIPTLATAFVASYEQLLALRFIACIGIGGALPNVIPYVAELMPKKVRAGAASLTMIAYAFGAVAVGAMAAFLVPRGHWSQVFLIIGLVGCALGVLLYFVLPESIRYLAVATPESEKLRQALRRIAPNAAIPPQARLMLESGQSDTKSSIADVFRGRFALLTLLLWAVFFFEGLTFAVFQNWVIILAERGGLLTATGSWIFTVGSVATIIVIALQAKILDAAGWIVPLVGTLIASLALLMLGQDLPSTILIGTMALLMAFTAAPHNALFSLAALVYPVELRGSGVGFATAVARVAQIVGPIAGGYLLAANFSLGQFGYFLAVPYILAAILCFVLNSMRKRSPEPRIMESVAV